jgi:hypothetical protein
MGGGGAGLPMIDSGVKSGWMVNFMPRSLYPRKRDLILILQEVRWVSGPVWKVPENFTPTRVRTPKHPTRSGLLADCAINLNLHALYIKQKTDDKKANKDGHLEAK